MKSEERLNMILSPPKINRLKINIEVDVHSLTCKQAKLHIKKYY